MIKKLLIGFAVVCVLIGIFKPKEEMSFAPKVFANSLGMFITNTDKFALKPVSGKAVFFLKVAALDTAHRLGLRWYQFATKEGGAYPHKLMQAEKVTVEVMGPDSISAEATFDIDPNAI
ncbi:hypothetical protein F1C16_08040 [Hymenobacter sp. NBH84]|uniref:hypothetical protein n=1 Tax=Hymenobacter sp. NBH84 TaxID=2596915 RepID=UPI00162655A6|nr:hypothetical protein [Hymenobacter sp. NBH84]QNE39506.1 hypothetical protein F1C16_08040 [Hymenobacter sp. NBH84]